MDENPSTLKSDSLQCMEVWGGNSGISRNFHLPGLDVWLYSRPHNNVASGGDVYYLSSCASGRITRLLLSDISGHGAAVSQCAGRLRDLMRKHINRVSQSKFVADINQHFTELAGSTFATAVVGTFFASTRSLQLCTAGHPQPLLFRQKSGNWETSVPRDQNPNALADLPLGITQGVEYQQSQVTLNPGDMMLAYTDGVTEIRLADNHLLNTSGLRLLAQSLSGTEPERFLSALVDEVCQNATAPIDDDLTLMLLRSDGTTTAFRDNLLAPLRILRGGRDKTRFRE